MTYHCRAMKGKESLENLNEKEGRNGDDNYVRDKRVSFKNRPACRAGPHSGCGMKYIQGDIKKRELLKNPTKIEKIQEKKNIDRN